MKLFTTATLAAVTLAGAVAAATPFEENRIQQYAPNADVQSLSAAEVNALLATINGGDTETEKRRIIFSLLKQ